MHDLCHDFGLVAKLSGNKLDILNLSLFFFWVFLYAYAENINIVYIINESSLHI